MNLNAFSFGELTLPLEIIGGGSPHFLRLFPSFDNSFDDADLLDHYLNRDKAFISQNVQSPQGSPNSLGSFSKQFPWTSQAFCLNCKSFQGITTLGKAKLLRLQGGGGGGEKPRCPSFSSANPFSEILTSTGWKSRLIRQESLARPPAAVFRWLRAPPPSERGVMKSGGRPRGLAGGTQWRNYLSKVPSSAELLA